MPVTSYGKKGVPYVFEIWDINAQQVVNSHFVTAPVEDVQSPPSQRRRTDDSTSTGDLQPMPTSPPVGTQSPNVQDALFSSPPQFQSSGTFGFELDKLLVATQCLFLANKVFPLITLHVE